MRKSILYLQSRDLTPAGVDLLDVPAGMLHAMSCPHAAPAQALATGPAQGEGRTEDNRAKEAHTPESQLHTEQWSPGQGLRSMGHVLRLSLMG